MVTALERLFLVHQMLAHTPLKYVCIITHNNIFEKLLNYFLMLLVILWPHK